MQENYNAPYKLWGDAITYTRIDEKGRMWAGNGEYETQVNYCPFTGTPAPKQMTLTEKIIRTKTVKEYK